MSSKNPFFRFQVRTSLALVLMTSCAPVFAFNSAWFPSEIEYRNTFLALLLFMVVSYSMAYLGKVIRTGGAS
jgi:hypothetical protein